MERYGQRLFVRDDREQQRLDRLSEVFDPIAISTLVGLGVRPDARCLEVGAGSGSIASWLCDRAVDGEVVATDIELSMLDQQPARDNLTTLRHDVTCDPFPAGSLDVIHARLVLSHLPQRMDVLRRMRSWLRPGGFVLIESFCWFPVDSSPEPVYRAGLQRWSDLVCSNLGTDSWWSRRHPGSFTTVGLREVGANTVVQNLQGGTPLADFWGRTVEMSRERLVDEGYLTVDELDRFAALLRDPGFWDLAPALTQAWGRR